MTNMHHKTIHNAFQQGSRGHIPQWGQDLQIASRSSTSGWCGTQSSAQCPCKIAASHRPSQWQCRWLSPAGGGRTWLRRSRSAKACRCLPARKSKIRSTSLPNILSHLFITLVQDMFQMHLSERKPVVVPNGTMKHTPLMAGTISCSKRNF